MYVRYLHGNPKVGEIDILDGEIPVVKGLSFGQMTPYFFAQNSKDYRVVGEQGELKWKLAHPEMSPVTTWVLTGHSDQPVLVPVEDPTVEMEKPALRLANFGSEGMNLYIGALPEELELFIQNVEPGEVTEYHDTAPGEYFADLRSNIREENAILARIPRLSLKQNILYTLYIIGNEGTWRALLAIDGVAYLPDSKSENA